MDKPINVTRPLLAPLEEVTHYLKTVWESGVLTHNGPLLRQFESELMNKLNLPYCSVLVNGTVALQVAIKALNLKGEIITTPFTWVATASAINWEGCTPVFCDIDASTLNIDENKIESLITDKTVAIMPVHVFGSACNVNKIDAIAKKHDLKVIYDAAHAMGTLFEGKTVLEHGDISVISLHATKIVNCGEGGACFTLSEETDSRIKRIRFFGLNDNKEIVEDGLNGKTTELHAALGLANLKYFDQALVDRKRKYLKYKELLSANEDITFQKINDGQTNYSYFPVILPSEKLLLRVKKVLNDNQVFPRRYFHPSVNTYSKIVNYMPAPVSEDISKRIMCLPMSFYIKENEMEMICKIILSELRK